MGGPLTVTREKEVKIDPALDLVVGSQPQKDPAWWHIDTKQYENGNQPHVDDYSASEDSIDAELLTWFHKDFPYGWRDVPIITADGQEIWKQIPLTEYDALHPQEDDKIMNGKQHSKNTTYLDTTLETLYKPRPDTVVLNDVGVDLNLPGIEHVSPDIAVIFNVSEVKDWRKFYCKEEGVSPSVIFEVTSPSTRRNDFGKKYNYYQQAGIPYYVILDVKYNSKKEVDHYRLYVYELIGSKYVEIEPSNQGRYWLPPLGIWIDVGDDGILCYDEDGNLLLSHDELALALADSERIREEATQRAEEQEQIAQQEARRAEKQEKIARQEAQRAVEQEQLARQEAQRAEEQEQIARQEAQRAEEQEKIARQEAQRAEEQEKIARQEAQRAEEQKLLAQEEAQRVKAKEQLLQKERLEKEAVEEENARLRAIIEQLGEKL